RLPVCDCGKNSRDKDCENGYGDERSHYSDLAMSHLKATVSIPRRHALIREAIVSDETGNQRHEWNQSCPKPLPPNSEIGRKRVAETEIASVFIAHPDSQQSLARRATESGDQSRLNRNPERQRQKLNKLINQPIIKPIGENGADGNADNNADQRDVNRTRPIPHPRARLRRLFNHCAAKLRRRAQVTSIDIMEGNPPFSSLDPDNGVEGNHAAVQHVSKLLKRVRAVRAVPFAHVDLHWSFLHRLIGE